MTINKKGFPDWGGCDCDGKCTGCGLEHPFHPSEDQLDVFAKERGFDRADARAWIMAQMARNCNSVTKEYKGQHEGHSYKFAVNATHLAMLVYYFREQVIQL
jgi:hypothetical protein